MENKPMNFLKKFLRDFVLPHWREGLIAGLLISLSVLLQFAFPLLAKDVIDRVIERDGLENLTSLISVLVGAVVLAALASFSSEVLTLKIRENIIFSLEKRILRHIHRLPLSFFSNQHATYLQARVMSDARSVEGILIRALLTLGISGITFLVGAALVFSFRWEMGVSLLLIIVPFAYIRYFGNEKMRQYSLLMQEQQALASQGVAESFAGVRTTKLFARESLQDEKLATSLDCLHNIYIKTNRIGIFTSVGTAFLGGLGSIIILGLGAWFVIQGQLTVGEVFAVLSLIGITYSPVNSLISTNLNMQQAAVSIKRIYELLEVRQERSTGVDKDLIEGYIEFRNVEFRYQREVPVLSGINLTLPKGRKVALVGKTGSGKSTLLNLLLGFYRPDTGEVLIDGCNIETLSLDTLRNHLGIVDQQSILFTGTLADNIRFGKLDASQEEVERAAHNAFADEFIDELPNKYETVIGERGTRLSGGQIQRIMMARLFLKDPSVLILDEALAAVDSQSEAYIQHALDRLLKGRTAIIIAHRLSSLLAADHVVVLENGIIAEEGSHEDLISNDGPYACLFEDQFEVKGNVLKKKVAFAH